MGRCRFQLIPATTEKRVMVVDEEKPLQPQGGAISLTELWRWGC